MSSLALHPAMSHKVLSLRQDRVPHQGEVPLSHAATGGSGEGLKTVQPKAGFYLEIFL